MARTFIAFLDRISTEYNRGAIAWRIRRTLCPGLHRVDLGRTADRNRNRFDRGAVDALGETQDRPKRRYRWCNRVEYPPAVTDKRDVDLTECVRNGRSLWLGNSD